MALIKREKEIKKLKQAKSLFCVRIHEKKCNSCPIHKMNDTTSKKKHEAMAKQYCEQCVDKKCNACLFQILILDALYG